MPLKKSGAMRASGLVAAVCSVLAVIPAGASAADSPDPCPWEATSKVFALVGDLNDYFRAPGGTFEGTLQWTLSGAASQVASDSALTGEKVVALGAGASAASPPVCVDATRPHIRFAVKAPRMGEGTLRLDAVDGEGVRTVLGTVDAAAQRLERTSQGWSASPMLPLSTALGVTSGSRAVNLVVSAESADWQVDEVNIDPMRR